MATKPLFVFDLDDTLYPERQYSLSALSFIGERTEHLFNVENASEELCGSFQSGETDAIGVFWERHNLPTEELSPLIVEMQKHKPAISLYDDCRHFLGILNENKIPYAIVTDGRSVTQREKISQLGLNNAVAVCISEETGACKPDSRAFEPVMQHLPESSVIFVGDNPLKDFAFPNQLGWVTAMRQNDGSHIREQILPEDISFHPQRVISSFDELECFL